VGLGNILLTIFYSLVFMFDQGFLSRDHLPQGQLKVNHLVVLWELVRLRKH